MNKVVHGQNFKTALRADTWNNFVDAAQDFKDRQANVAGRGADLLDDTFNLRNDSGLAVPRYGVLWAEQLPTDKTFELPVGQRPPCPYLSQIVIAAEPIPAASGSVGRVWREGFHPVLIEGWDDLSNDGILPCLAITQTDSFVLRRHGGSWGVPIIAKHGTEDLAMAMLPVVPPPMVRIKLTAAQALTVYGDASLTWFDAAFLEFPDALLSAEDYYGLAVE